MTRLVFLNSLVEQGLKNAIVIIDAQNCELGHSLSQIKTSPRTKAVMICAVQIVTQSSRSTSLFCMGWKSFDGGIGLVADSRSIFVL